MPDSQKDVICTNAFQISGLVGKFLASELVFTTNHAGLKI